METDVTPVVDPGAEGSESLAGNGSAGPTPLPEGVAAEGAPGTLDGKPAPSVSRIRLKVGDAEEEYDPAELSRLVGKRKELDRASFQRFQEAAKARQEVEALLQQAKTDPWALLQKAGVDPVQAAMERLQREVEQADMTPEQRALAERELQLRQREAQIAQWQQQQETQQVEAQRQQFVAQLDQQVPAAMERAGLPKSPIAANYVARALGEMYDAGIPLDFDVAAEVAKDMYTNDFKSHASGLKYEQLVQQYPEVVEVIRKGDLASARKAVAAPQSAPATKRPGTPESSTKSSLNDRPIFGHDEWSSMGIVRQPNPR